MKHKKLVILLGLLLIASLVLVACGGGAEETTAPEAPEAPEEETGVEEPPAPAEKAKVVIFIGMGTGTDPDQIAAQEALQEEFNSTHENIEVEFLIVPNEEAPERYLAMISGGNAPQLVGPNGISTVAQFYDTWVDITPFIEADNLDLSDFYGPAVELNSYPDKVVGLPLGLFPSFLFYNNDLFDAAGLDYPTHDYADTSWNLEKLRELALQLTLDANGNNANSPDFDPNNIVQWGYDDSWINATGFLAGFDAPTVGRAISDDYKTAVANSEEWVYGLDWINQGIWVDHFIPDATGQEAYYAVGGDPFGGSLVAMFYSHTWFMPEGLVDLPFEHDIAPAPFNHKGTRVARIHADTFTIPRDAENQEAAWEVLKWLTSEEHIIDVCLIYGCLPARQSVGADFQAALAERFPGLDYDVIFESIDYLDNPNHEAYMPEWGRIHDVMENAFGEVYVGQIEDPQAVLDQANQDIQDILDEYWAEQ
jgi:multiple sugar transport system substrate-binding protein